MFWFASAVMCSMFTSMISRLTLPYKKRCAGYTQVIASVFEYAVVEYAVYEYAVYEYAMLFANKIKIKNIFYFYILFVL